MATPGIFRGILVSAGDGGLGDAAVGRVEIVQTF